MSQSSSSIQKTAVLVGDPHGNVEAIKRIAEHIKKVAKDTSIDVILVTGDIGKNILPPRRSAHHGETYIWKHDCVEVLQTLEDTGIPVVYTPGNHDLPDMGRHISVGGTICTDRNVVTVGGWKILGWGGAENNFGWPYEWDRNQAQADFDKLMKKRGTEDIEILLSHDPPHKICDKTLSGYHAGSKFVRSVMDRFDFVASGHIHEAYGLDSKGECGTIVANAGGLGMPAINEHIVWLHKRGNVCWAVSEHLTGKHYRTAVNLDCTEKKGEVAIYNTLHEPKFGD